MVHGLATRKDEKKTQAVVDNRCGPTTAAWYRTSAIESADLVTRGGFASNTPKDIRKTTWSRKTTGTASLSRPRNLRKKGKRNEGNKVPTVGFR